MNSNHSNLCVNEFKPLYYVCVQMKQMDTKERSDFDKMMEERRRPWVEEQNKRRDSFMNSFPFPKREEEKDPRPWHVLFAWYNPDSDECRGLKIYPATDRRAALRLLLEKSEDEDICELMYDTDWLEQFDTLVLSEEKFHNEENCVYGWIMQFDFKQSEFSLFDKPKFWETFPDSTLDRAIEITKENEKK